MKKVNLFTLILMILIVLQISKRDIEGYNGVGKPPHYEMIFKATSDVSTPCDLTVKIIIQSRFKNTEVDIFRAAEIPCKGQSHC